MKKEIIVFTLVVLSAISISARSEEQIQLTPREGVHQFPFFDHPTPIWGYNGTTPGPVLKAKEGTVLNVDLLNKLSEPTSVHWHGLRVANEMDGVPGVTQDPIQPGESFRYRLDLRDAGTFWYHPHLNPGEQMERGLKGVLIVEEKDPLPWSQDVVWLLDDWRMQQDGTIYPHFNTHPDLMHDGRWGNAITINGQVQPEIQALPGERIRLRLINGANARVFLHQFEGVAARVIAVDGRPVSKIFPYGDFYLSPGNRVDLDIVIPKDAAGKRFSLVDRFTRNEITLGTIEVSKAAPVKTPDFEVPLLTDFIPASQFEGVGIAKTWKLDAVQGGEFGIGWAMNRQLWPHPDRIDFLAGKPVKVKFDNVSTRLHPMHIHGTFFRVLSVNGKPAVEPFTRDTVLLGPRQSVVVGLIPDIRGIWLTHCHIQAHAESGMMTTIEVD